MYYLSGIAQALIEHADLAFSLSPNNHYDIKSEMASLYMSGIPSSQWLRHVYLYIYLFAYAYKRVMYLFLSSQPVENILYIYTRM